MKKFHCFAMLLIVLAVSGLCWSCDEDPVEGEKEEKVSLSVSPTKLNFGAAGGEQTIAVTTNGKYTNAECAAEWLHLKVTAEGNVEVTANENTTFEERKADIIVSVGETADFAALNAKQTSCKVSVSQSATEVTLTVEPTSLCFDAEGGSQMVTVSTNAKCLSAQLSDTWIDFRMSEDGTLEFVAEPNPTFENRETKALVCVGATEDFMEKQAYQATVEITITQLAAEPKEEDEVYDSNVKLWHWVFRGTPVTEPMKEVADGIYEYHFQGPRFESWGRNNLNYMYVITETDTLGVFDVVKDRTGRFAYAKLNPWDWFTDSAEKDWTKSEYFNNCDCPSRTNDGTSPYGDASAWYRTTPESHLVWTGNFANGIDENRGEGEAYLRVNLNDYTLTFCNNCRPSFSEDYWYAYGKADWAGMSSYVLLNNYNDKKIDGLNSGVLMVPINDSDEDNGDYVVQHSLWWWYKGERYRLEHFAPEDFVEGTNKYGDKFIFITSRLVKGDHKCTMVDVDRGSWTDHLQLKNETTLLWPKWNTERISVGVYKKNGEWWGFIFSSDAPYPEDIEALCQ